MLQELHVRDIALIEEAWLEFGPGMTVLSGETGAGKTALVGALKLLLGERADSGAVRAGASETLVEGRFLIDDGELLVRRRVGADGRSRCAIDGEMATVGALAERVGPLVDLHGQHEHQALLSPASHVGYLDRWAGPRVEAARADYLAAYEKHAAAVSELASVQRAVSEGARDADYLAFVAAEIQAVDPQRGEDEVLRSRLPALQHAERLSEAASHVVGALKGEGAALDRLAEAGSALERVGGIDPRIDEIASRIEEIRVELDDVGTTAREYRDAVEHDPATLNEVVSRLSALKGLTKKYGPSLDEVLARKDAALATLAAADDGERAVDEAIVRVARAEEALKARAAELDEARRSTCPGFEEALQDATRELAMDGVRFEVDVAQLAFEDWTADGPHRVEFMFAPAPGQPARQLARIASGGEVSRVMLALKGVLGGADTVGSLVFDEIDTGVGGATATAVGRRLAELARNHQVIVVTHLAQVAAFADAHLVVTKSTTAEGATTSVRTVAGAERVSEVARMLSGNDSSASRQHASELIEAARAGVTSA